MKTIYLPNFNTKIKVNINNFRYDNINHYVVNVITFF